MGWGRKVTVNVMATDKRRSGSGVISVQVEAKHMNTLQRDAALRDAVCKASGISDRDAHNVIIDAYEIED